MNIPPSSVDDISLALSQMAVETPADDVPGKAYAAAKVALLDALGCAFAGRDAPGVAPVVELTKEWGGREEATVWFNNFKAPAPAAAFANGAQLHALDFDDYHAPSNSHIASVVVPAVLAAGEMAGASGRDVLAALALGVEVVGRLGRACIARREYEGFLPTSVVGGFGAAAAACRLYGCTAAQTVDALGVWYAHASGNRQALFDRTLTKRIQPAVAAKGALFSCRLAQRGVTGPRRIVGAQPASLTRIYGFYRGGDANAPTVGEVMAPRPEWAVEELLYKQYASCGVSWQAMASAIALAEEHGLTPEMVEEMRLFGHKTRSPFGGVPWTDSPDPQALAQFCMPYATASAIRNRCYGPAEIAPARIAQDQAVDALARRAQLCSEEDWPGEPLEGGTGVELRLKDGRTIRAQRTGHLCMVSPQDDEKIIEKLKGNLAHSRLLDDAGTAGFIDAVQGLDECGNIGEFVRRWLWAP